VRNRPGNRFGRRASTTAVAAATLVVVAACGSSSGTKGTSGTSPSSSASALTGTPIKIGVIGGLTGIQSSSTKQVGVVAPAWAAYVNAHGGINGSPVEVIVGDDFGDPAKAQATEKRLVDSDQVVAIVEGSDALTAAYEDDALKKGVVLVSGASNSRSWYSKPGMFSTTTDVASGVVGQLDVGVKYGKSKVFGALYCAEVPACAESTPLLQGAAARAGVKLVSLPVSSSASSYTAQCLQLKQKKADYVQLNFSSAAAAKFIQDCSAQGYTPIYGSSEQAIGSDYLSVRGVTIYGPAYAFPSVLDSPGAQSFRDAMKAYAKGDGWQEGSGSFTWQGLEAVRKAIGTSASPTRKTVLDGMNSFKDEDLGGLLANKLTFQAGKAPALFSRPCYFIVGIKDGKVIAPSGAAPDCSKPLTG
jgi:branched-chain amino acid transport system substrate-binding protein